MTVDILPLIEDKIAAAFTMDAVQFTPFLNLEESAAALDIIRHSGVFYKLWGGFEGAQRQMIALSGEACDISFPISILKGTWDKFSEISHRDVLGAVLASGIERKCLGDILLQPKEHVFYIFAQEKMAPFILQHVSSIGRASVRFEIATQAEQLPAPVFREIRVSVSSLRIDCVMAAVGNFSRTACRDLIEGKKVFLNHALVVKPTSSVSVGDTLIIRGIGKFTVEEIGGLSRKGKTYIFVKQYC